MEKKPKIKSLLGFQIGLSCFYFLGFNLKICCTDNKSVVLIKTPIRPIIPQSAVASHLLFFTSRILPDAMQELDTQKWKGC
jgi:hypothetical protein